MPRPGKVEPRPTRPTPQAIRYARKAAEFGLTIIGPRWAAWINWQFLNEPEFRAAMPREPVRLSRHAWVIWPPPHLIRWPPGSPARLMDLPPMLIDTRPGVPAGVLGRPGRPVDARLPAALASEVAQSSSGLNNDMFLTAMAGLVQGSVNEGTPLKRAIRQLAEILGPTPGPDRRLIEQQLTRTWHRLRLQRSPQNDALKRRSPRRRST